VKNYDPKQIIVSVGGNIIVAFAAGTFLSASRNEAAFVLTVGADGETARARSRNRSGLLTLTLMQTSPSNDVLSAFAAADELSGTGVVPVLVKDLLGTSLLAAQNGWVQKLADVEFGAELSNREWVIECDFLGMFAGGAL
jgi:hypothetical protein